MYSITETPFINCTWQLREQKLSYPFLFQVIEAFTGHSRGSNQFTFKVTQLSALVCSSECFFKTFKTSFFKTLKTSPSGLDVKAAFLVAFYYAFEAYNPQRIWSHFCGISSFTKNVRATLQAEVTRASKIWLWIFNAFIHESGKIGVRKSNVRLGRIGFIVVLVSSISFDAELNGTQSMNRVRLSSIEI